MKIAFILVVHLIVTIVKLVVSTFSVDPILLDDSAEGTLAGECRSVPRSVRHVSRLAAGDAPAAAAAHRRPALLCRRSS
jgi:hypothetical protein